MAFEIAESTARTIWLPVDGTSTVYVGQIVYMGLATPAGTGVITLGAASGASNTSNKFTPLGIIVGTNNRTPLFNSTYMTEYITGVNSVAAQAARLPEGFGMAEGMWSKSDPQPLVQVALIDQTTYIKGPIRNAALATAPTTQTVTTGAAGTGFTANAAEFTPVAYNATALCLTGANAGLYRISSDTSATVRTFAKYYPYTISVGDTFKNANIALGTCRMQFDSTAQWIENSAALTSNYFTVEVIKISLGAAAEDCWAIFKFGGDNFTAARA